MTDPLTYRYPRTLAEAGFGRGTAVHTPRHASGPLDRPSRGDRWVVATAVASLLGGVLYAGYAGWRDGTAARTTVTAAASAEAQELAACDLRNGVLLRQVRGGRYICVAGSGRLLPKEPAR